MDSAAPTLPDDETDLPEIFVAQIAKRLRGCDPSETPMLGWLEDRMQRQGTTLDDVVARAHARQGASNVTMRNIVTSMRTLSELDWADFFEDVSVVDACLSARVGFRGDGFRDPQLVPHRHRAPRAEGRDKARSEVARAALELAWTGDDERARDPGHALIGAARNRLESAIGFVPSPVLRFQRQAGRLGLGGYAAAIGLSTAAVLGAAGWGLHAAGASALELLPLAILALLPASEAATSLTNLCVTRSIRPSPLPALDLATGVPPHLRTLVAVPVLLTGPDDLAAHLERLEVHHLSSVGGAVHYALLSDGPDAATETTGTDAALIALAEAGIARLNASYPSTEGNRFLLLHRERRWNASEHCWMGWERKRGKLSELNDLLRGAHDTSFLPSVAPVPQDVRFVITLDADTRLPRDAVQRLIGKLAHPLNRPQARCRGVAGHRGLRHPPATGDRRAAGRAGRLALSADQFGAGRHRTLCRGHLGRLSGSLRRGLVHRQGDLRHRRVRRLP